MNTTTIGQMTQAEFKKMLETVIESTIEEKLLELFGDPDEGLAIREDVRERLLRQKQAVAAGGETRSFEDAIKELGLE